jgi:hypothetical protein
MIRRLLAPFVAGSRKLTAGFTLVELMVALTGGLFVSVAVFMLARQATGLYQQEGRISNATLGSVVGFERLRLDIERAGYLASLNIRRDPAVCGFPDSNWPKQLGRMSSVLIRPATSALPPGLTDNNILPDELILAGSYASVEQFWTKSIELSGPNNMIVLQGASPAMARLGYANVAAANQRALLLSVFGVGRAIRIVDTEAHEQYGTIVDVQPGSDPAILVSASNPRLTYRGATAPVNMQCGVMGNGKDHLVNVVNFVKYSLRNMAGFSQFGPLYQSSLAGGTPVTDFGRTELVREELDTDGTSIFGTEEIISEFAVDLRFGISVTQILNPGSPNQTEQLKAFSIGDTNNIKDWAGDPPGLPATNGPQRIRTVRARLSVRSREGDRLTNLSGGDGGTLPIAPGLYRFGLGVGGVAPFARVRTMQADIALRNHRGVAWL